MNYFQGVDENSKLSLNKSYTNKRTKFKITAALQKETPQEVMIFNLFTIVHIFHYRDKHFYRLKILSTLSTKIGRCTCRQQSSVSWNPEKSWDTMPWYRRFVHPLYSDDFNWCIFFSFQQILAQSKVSFAPSIGMIKKCIESLIDKQYIERTPNSGDEYSYVA